MLVFGIKWITFDLSIRATVKTLVERQNGDLKKKKSIFFFFYSVDESHNGLVRKVPREFRTLPSLPRCRPRHPPPGKPSETRH